MIQRIQTLYLFAIVVLIGLTLMMPIADFISQAQHAIYQLKCSGVWQIIPTGNVLHATVWSLSSVVGVIPVLALIAIFQYKDRVKQIRLCVINFVFIILFYVSLFVNIWLTAKDINANWSLDVASLFPLVAAILNYLAIGAIGKDEALVKSLDRLR
jgi:hypothetical protein